MSPSDEAFQELARIFSTRKNRVLEIELLPPGLGPLLQDECSIGITKKYLVQAFVTARRTFFENCTNTLCDFASAAAGDDIDSIVQEYSSNRLGYLLVSTEIILLFDCEHLTACNWRKRFLEARKKRHGLVLNEQEPFIPALDAELTLMTTYLCSPLPRHTKSPTLWQHRLWVLHELLQVGGLEAAFMHPQTGRPVGQNFQSKGAGYNLRNAACLLTSELAIVLRAGELHPRNYYAFSYMRQIFELLRKNLEETFDVALLAEPMINTVLDWCLAHPSDISGWMFQLHLLKTVQKSDLHVRAVDKVICYALDIGWEGESLWTFVDLSVRGFDLRDTLSHKLQVFPRTPITELAALDGGIPPSPWKTWLTLAKAYWTDGQQECKDI
ncbi:hypothetical protein BDV25DRAFT_74039 [Aspergillus avenaceus]|uniref:Uncharacterized protein n=1 Tax=Aspergillus avenaceus TaxID=36643 RepID=A0A5N6TFY0_ASPAV|nr:hypothetical protein BDV25DRAFT_74039 [Aspergillus avenaceus]